MEIARHEICLRYKMHKILQPVACCKMELSCKWVLELMVKT
ncbi:hypothetical protein HMPREF3213_00672 [Heyndrickxia coagulans]|uniref:Uncharacterized protein n=1 Tax=Heyndrickxia coagulans TaxID=1398 RepID=A0A133KZR4_HEYCO|nr:hypothetical protein HMPREF3213_00672 [Heyndrickxia coagulans]